MMNGVCRPGRKTTYIGSIFLALCLHAVLAGTVWAERMSVNADKANIRSGPGTEKYDVLWEVNRYTRWTLSAPRVSGCSFGISKAMKAGFMVAFWVKRPPLSLVPTW